MNKHIHIHIHRTTDNDFKESDHPRASNGQFGSGGGGGKSGSSEKKGAPAIPTKHSNRGATALAQMQAASNKHLEQTGKGHVVKGKEATRAEAEHGSAKQSAYKGSKPDHIKSVSSANGKAIVTTNSGARHEVSAASTGGKMPKVGEHVGQYAGGKSGSSEKKGATPAKKLPASSKGPHGLEVHNLHHAAGGEKVQIRITSKEQAEWARKTLGLKAGGEGHGSYNLTDEQVSKLKSSM